MMDIKYKNIRPVKKIEKSDTEIMNKVSHFYNAPVSTSKAGSSKFSLFLFGLMFLSMSFYVFMISSSIFYAVKTSQFAYKAENISSVAQSLNMGDEELNKYSKDRISYINTDSDTSISLK